MNDQRSTVVGSLSGAAVRPRQPDHGCCRRSRQRPMVGHSRRLARGFCWCAHPASGRSRGRRPAFCATCRAVGLDVSGIDRGRGNDAARSGQLVEDCFPDALFAPAIESIVDRCVWPVFRRTVAPAGTLLSMWRTQLITRRSSTRWAPRRPRGNSISILRHSSSLSQ